MRLIILFTTLVSLAIAWDCSDAVNPSDSSAKAYCRSISSMLAVLEYDRMSIKAGERISTVDESTRLKTLSFISLQAEQCYQTCVLANTEFY